MADPFFLFDIGNVLIDFDLNRLLSELAAASGRPFEELSATWNDDDLVAVETGRMSGEAYHAKRVVPLAADWDYDRWIRLWEDVFTWNLNGRNLFLNLSELGHPVYILSNLAEYNKIALDRKFPELFPASRGNFFSYEMGLHKPDPQIYLNACEGIGAAPEDGVFLDDMEENVKGAESIGMRSIQVIREQFDLVLEQVEQITKL
jgi:FMN phosphatase YigB (HAD superfamily)